MTAVIGFLVGLLVGEGVMLLAIALGSIREREEDEDV